MPKQKPHNGLRKRVRITASGKVVRKLAGAGHLMSRKSGQRCRRLRHMVPLVGRPAETAKRALGLK
jgi:large subunit ribosomal protein L35